MSFKPAFKFKGQAEPSTNSQAFATYDEAHKSAEQRFRVWTMPEDFCVIESDEPVNYRWDDHLGNVMLDSEHALMAAKVTA
jgi:hypothetical protein